MEQQPPRGATALFGPQPASHGIKPKRNYFFTVRDFYPAEEYGLDF